MNVREMVMNIACMPLVWNLPVVISVGGFFYKRLCMLHDTQRKAVHSVTL